MNGASTPKASTSRASPGARRTGDSLRYTTNDVPTALMLTLGFTPSEAERLIRVRRILPFVDNSKEPIIDARKLWERIGKPRSRFNMWADQYIKPELEGPFTAQICAIKIPARGVPRTDYKVSRDIAAHLAMMARTPEGQEVRTYFLDMERLAVRLADHLGIRIDQIVTTDRMVMHDCTRRAAERAKAGKLDKSAIKADATDKERLIKSIACAVVTGQSTSWWRDTFNAGSVRDVLKGADLAAYASCYEAARAFINAGIDRVDKLQEALAASYGGRVSPAAYLKQSSGST